MPLLARANTPHGGEARLKVLSTDDTGIELELTVPGWNQTLRTFAGASYALIMADGLEEWVGEPGYPRLPAIRRLVALPPGAEAEVTVLDFETSVRTLSNPVMPAPELSSDLAGEVVEMRAPLAKAYQNDALYPQELVWVGPVSYIRDRRLVEIRIQPLRVNPMRNQLEYTRRLVVRIDFVGQEQRSAASRTASTLEWLAMLPDGVLNPAQAEEWRALPAGFRTPQPGLEIGIPIFKIEVDADGIYEVTYEELLAAGLEVTSTNPYSFSLMNQGEAVAIELFGDGDEFFEPGDGFYFYGQQFRGTIMEEKYTDVNVYWLDDRSVDGLFMNTIDGAPKGAPAITSYRATVHHEQDLIWHPVRTIDLGDQDTWYWGEKKVADPLGKPVTNTQSFGLTALADGSYTATIRVALFSECKYDCLYEKHHAQVFLNELLVDEQGQDGSWTNIQPRVFSATLSQSDHLSNTNVMAWVLRSDVVGWSSRGVYLNWFKVEYQRRLVAENDMLTFGGDLSGTWVYTVGQFTTDILSVWDISEPRLPVRLVNVAVEGSGPYSVTFQSEHATGARFIALGSPSIRSPLAIERYLPPDLDPPGGADWIAVSHPDLITEAHRLAAQREGEGYRTLVVNVEDLYNQYSDGIFQPAAIRDYLAHALSWADRVPTYALLVGDGNWNFFDISGYAIEINYIPPFLGFLDPYQGEVPADNLYVTLVGDDPMPDMALGRLPAGSAEEAALMVDKILDHENRLIDPEPWQFNIVFLSDDAEIGNDFPAQSDAVADLLPNYYTVTKVYYGQPSYTSTEVTQQAFIDAFDAGSTLLNYRGHGSLNHWGGSLFKSSSIPSLTNQHRLPVVVTMDCLDTYFAYPGSPSLSEDLFRHDDGGSVGQWGAAGLGISPDHTVLHQALFQQLFHDQKRRLGLAVLGAKLDFVSSGMEQHNLHTFTLIGDPAMPLTMGDYKLFLPMLVSN